MRNILHIACLNMGFDDQRLCLSYAYVYAHSFYRRCVDAFVWRHENIGLDLNRDACPAMHRSFRAQGCLAPAVSIRFIRRVNADDVCYSQCNGVTVQILNT